MNETINFSAATEAIEALVGMVDRLSTDLDRRPLNDIHIASGQLSERRGGDARPMGDFSMDLDAVVAEIAALTASAMGREISATSPILEQRIPPSYRVSVSHPTITQDGRWALTLRLLATEVIPLSRWMTDDFMSHAVAERLIELMAGPSTILVAGTIGAGKTTLLRSMLAKMPIEQRLVVIEDAAELNIDRPNTLAISTSASADLSDLLTHSFRLDAERIVVGEIRDHAAMQFLTLASGGTRAMTTIHAEPGVGALVRLHQLVSQSRFNVSMDQIAAAIHAVVTITRLADGRRHVDLWEN